MLFAPMLMVQRRIEKRFNAVETTQESIRSRQTETALEISSLAQDVEQTKNELHFALERLSVDFSERMSTNRRADREAIEAIEKSPSRQTVFSALHFARRRGYIPENGCRVHVLGTDTYLRFRAAVYDKMQNINPQIIISSLTIDLEGQSGDIYRTLSWDGSQSATDILVWLAKTLEDLHLYPGDKAFDAVRIFADLKALLLLTHEKGVGEHASYGGLKGVIQFCAPQWAVTDRSVIRVDGPYTIEVDRLEEMDWCDHVRSKGWADEASLYEAIESARALYRSGRLAAKP